MEEYLDEKEEVAKIQSLKENGLEQYNGVERSALSPAGIAHPLIPTRAWYKC